MPVTEVRPPYAGLEPLGGRILPPSADRNERSWSLGYVWLRDGDLPSIQETLGLNPSNTYICILTNTHLYIHSHMYTQCIHAHTLKYMLLHTLAHLFALRYAHILITHT